MNISTTIRFVCFALLLLATQFLAAIDERDPKRVEKQGGKLPLEVRDQSGRWQMDHDFARIQEALTFE